MEAALCRNMLRQWEAVRGDLYVFICHSFLSDLYLPCTCTNSSDK